jgi:quinol monooxygenase YgiN
MASSNNRPHCPDQEPTTARRYGLPMTDQQESERIGRYVRMVALPGQGAALADSLLRVAANMGRSPACEMYVVNRSVDEPDVVWITEIWRDEAGADAALGGELGEVGIGDVMALLAGPPDLIEVLPLGGAGLSG